MGALGLRCVAAFKPGLVFCSISPAVCAAEIVYSFFDLGKERYDVQAFTKS